MLESLVRSIHFISLFFWAGTLMIEWLLVEKELSRKEIARIARVDGVYGLAAVLAIGAGLTLWFGVGKPADFYTSNWVFHLKITLAILVGILSIRPTVFFTRNRKGDPSEIVQVPKSVRTLIRIELIITVLLPFLATLMARGVGYFGG